MSQIYKSLAAGPVPPTVPETFVTDVNSPAVPAANILNEIGGSTSVNNNNGIQTDGSSGGNTLTIQLTNRITGSVTTTDATPTTLVSFPLGSTPAVFTFDVQIACFNVTDVNGDGYFISGSTRTDGATATLCGNPDKIENEEVMDTANADMIVSGNNMVIQAIGIAGKTHRWRAVITYVQVI